LKEKNKWATALGVEGMLITYDKKQRIKRREEQIDYNGAQIYN
jgi:hypothetical protein